MKKILSALVFAICLSVFDFCSAYDPYRYNPDYMYLSTFGIDQHSWYLYIPSVDVQEYNPPHYQIAGRFVTYVDGINGKYQSESWRILVHRYNWYTKESFSLDDNGNWKKDPDGNSNAERSYRISADALFKVAYGMYFYGY